MTSQLLKRKTNFGSVIMWIMPTIVLSCSPRLNGILFGGIVLFGSPQVHSLVCKWGGLGMLVLFFSGIIKTLLFPPAWAPAENWELFGEGRWLDMVDPKLAIEKIDRFVYLAIDLIRTQWPRLLDALIGVVVAALVAVAHWLMV